MREVRCGAVQAQENAACRLAVIYSYVNEEAGVSALCSAVRWEQRQKAAAAKPGNYFIRNKSKRYTSREKYGKMFEEELGERATRKVKWWWLSSGRRTRRVGRRLPALSSGHSQSPSNWCCRRMTTRAPYHLHGRLVPRPPASINTGQDTRKGERVSK